MLARVTDKYSSNDLLYRIKKIAIKRSSKNTAHKFALSGGEIS